MATISNPGTPPNPLIPTETGVPGVPPPAPHDNDEAALLAQLPDGFADALERRFGAWQPTPTADRATTTLPDESTIPSTPLPVTPTVPPADPRTGGADPGEGGVSATPSPTASPTDPPAPVTAPAAAPDTYEVVIAGQTRTLTSAQLQQMLALQEWANNVAQNPELAQQIAALEYGQAVAIPRDEYLRLAQQQAAATPGAPGTPAPTPAPQRPDLSFADPEVQAYIAQLEATRAQAAAAPATDPVAQQQLAAAQQQLAYFADQQRQQLIMSTADAMEAASQSFAQTRGINEDQLEALRERALELGAYRHFAEQGRVTNPVTGAVLADPDWSQVTHRALELAALDLGVPLATAPTPTAPTPTATTPTATTAAPTPTPTTTTVPSTPPNDQVVATKKANAASLAAAPGASMPTPTIDPRAVQPMQVAPDIANFLRDQGITGS